MEIICDYVMFLGKYMILIIDPKHVDLHNKDTVHNCFMNYDKEKAFNKSKNSVYNLNFIIPIHNISCLFHKFCLFL